MTHEQPATQPEPTPQDLIEIAKQRNAPLYERLDERRTAVSGAAQYLIDLRADMHPEAELPSDQE